MPIPAKVLKYLDKNKVKCEIILHRTVFTAFDVSATLKKELKEVAKILLIKIGTKDYALAILTASQSLDLKKLEKLISKKITLPKEKVIKEKFKINVNKNCFSAFGSVYKLPIYLDKKLLNLKKIILPSGSFENSVLIAIKDFLKLEEPIIGIFGIAKKIKKQK